VLTTEKKSDKYKIMGLFFKSKTAFSNFFILCIITPLLFSCASRPGAYKEIDLAVGNGDFEGAVEKLTDAQKSKKPIYAERNAIMLFLDKGLLEHYAGDYENSSRSLQEAERMIEEAYTKSITAGFMSYIVNDNTKEYPGEDFEDIYINVFNALNYYRRGNIEGALVEIRKLSMSNGKLDMLARRYEYKDPNSGASLEELVQKEAGRGQLPRGKPVDFSNSALARYLAALFYLAGGNTDSARIEFEQVQRAFLTNRNVYQNPFPSAVEQARNVPAGMARLNVIGFAGLSPVKEEEVVVHYFPFFQSPAFHVANFKLPKLVERPSVIDRIEVTAGQERFQLELLEDMGAVIRETFAVRYANIVIKTYIRTLLKYVTADVAAAVTSERQSPLAGLAIALAARAAFEATESADIRMSRYLPNRAYIGGVNLPPGNYDVTVNFYSGSRLIKQAARENVQVRANTLNLIDAVSLQ